MPLHHVWRKARTVALIAVLTGTLAACDETLYSNLSEADANEMLVTLLKRGVDASKSGAGDTFSIKVPKEDLIRSLEIIQENSLPRQRFETLGSVFSGQGMIASQTEEQARLAFAISQELSATFSKIDGVLDARVHVVLVQHEQSSGLTTPPSCAVFIRHTADSPVTSMLAEIRDTAARAVPGLTLDRVSIMTELYEEAVRAPQQQVLPWYEKPGTLLPALAAFLCAAAAAAVLILRRLGFKLSREASGKDKEQAHTDSSQD